MLRDYQSMAIAETWQHFREGRRSVLLQMPTGAGKTRTAVEGCKTLAAAGKRIWWLTHRRELVRQSSQAFKGVDVNHGIITPGSSTQAQQRIQVASIGTIRNRADKLPPPDLIVWDETRHLRAKTWRDLYERFPDARHWGLDATPVHASGGLGDFYEVMVRGPSVAELIERGHLSRYRLFTPDRPDLSGVHHRAGEFVQSEIQHIMDRPVVVGSAVDQYRKHADKEPALLFAVSIEASENAARQFREAGYRFRHVDGNTPSAERDAAIADFTQGGLDGITSVQIFTEGTDLPGVHCIIDLRPTESVPLYLQMHGRGMRPSEKPLTILSHSGNVDRHGFIDDDREWSLDVVQKKVVNTDKSQSKECRVCFCRYRIHLRACPECGHVLPVASRQVEQVAGELYEVDVDAERKKRSSSPAFRAQGRVRTLEGLAELFQLQRAQKLGRPLNPDEIMRQERRAQYVLEARRRKHG